MVNPVDHAPAAFTDPPRDLEIADTLPVLRARRHRRFDRTRLCHRVPLRPKRWNVLRAGSGAMP